MNLIFKIFSLIPIFFLEILYNCINWYSTIIIIICLIFTFISMEIYCGTIDISMSGGGEGGDI